MVWYAKNKYKNIRQTFQGYSYMSRSEAQYAAELDMRKKAKDIKEWTRQIRIPLKIYGLTICNIVVDFQVTHNDGSIELVEYKGFSTDLWKIKWKMLQAIYGKEHPEIKLTVVYS